MKLKKNSGYFQSIWGKSLFLFLFSSITILLPAQVVITGDDIVCDGEPAALHAEVTGIDIGTTSYNFTLVDFETHPPFSGGAAIDPDFINCNTNYDDCWAGGTPPNHSGYNIGFTFCFFNEQYTKFYVGSNGWIGFTDPTGHSWTTYTATPIPNTNPNVPKNCIFAPWQDWWPGYNGAGPNVFYYTTGSAPNRKLVVYWIECPLYGCPNDVRSRGTFMIVLNEGTSVVENFLQYKPNCTSSNEGSTQGVHNADGTIAFTATGRNYQVWEAFNEGTRFEPSGITWYKDIYPGGNIVGYGPDIIVNPTVTTQYFAVIGTCNGGTATGSFTVTVNPAPTTPIISGLSVACQDVVCQYTTLPGMTSYDWTGTTGTITGGGTSADNYIDVVWNTLGPQLVRVTYSSAEGCPALNPGELTITVATFETPIISGVPEICPGVNTTFTTQSGMQNYLWSYPGAVLVSGGGTSDDFIEVNWMTSGTKTISANFTNANGCTATSPTEFNVTVNPIPNVVPATPSPVIICSGTNAQVALSSSVPGTEAITTFAWTASGNATTVTPDPSTISGSGDILQNLANAGNIAEPVVFHILPTAAGCSPNVPADFTFNVNPVPVTQSSPGSQQIICSATSTLPITLQTNVLGLSPTYAWTSLCDPLITNCPPTSGNSNPVASFTPGNPTLSQKTITFSIVASLTATTGVCPGPELVYTILVNPLPISTFTSSTPSPVCQDFPTPSFYTVDPGGPASTYSWVVTPPANAVIADPTANPASITWKLAGSSPQNALLTLTAVTSGPDPVCTTNSSASVTINPKPPAQLTPCFELVTNRSAKRFLLKGGTPLLTSTPLQGEYLSDPSTTALSSDASGNFYFNPALVTGTNTRTFDITYRYTSSQYGCIATSPSATLTVMAANPPCSGSMTDVRDGTVYTTALLPDGRCWMTKNLRYGTPLSPSTVPQTDNCTVEKYCLSSDPACTANGGFYQWDELIQFGNTDGPAYQGVCPPGWHIPTQQEWQSLINSLTGLTPGDGVAGGYLKDQNQANGFRALLKGIYYLNNTWAFISGNSLTATMFWTSTPSGSNRAIARGMNKYNNSVSLYPSSRANAFNIRCVKD